ncbi:MAG: gamma-glutamyltransferase [Firmicutes bacterium]|nr:gamma-glutamyltransferase [Alicyclobacillaceae bacterium]MCL6496165.1 gamma-glutamyltransferase [Bacillota bacterium]
MWGAAHPTPTVWAPRAMVASGHPLASAAGLGMLQRGGNAADAVAAMAFVTAVVMPDMCGLGGDAFAVVAGGGNDPRAWLGSGALPAGYREERLPPGPVLPLRGGAAVAVPGATQLAIALHRRYGRLSLTEVAAPAIRLAREGFLVDARLAGSVAECQALLAQDPAAAARFLPGGVPVPEGARLAQPELATALEAVVASEGEALYSGGLASAVATAVQAQDGFLTAADLAHHRTREEAPLELAWGPFTVLTPPPPSAGVVLLEALGILREEAWEPDWRQSDEAVHRVIEALRLAFADRRNAAGDPERVAYDARAVLDPVHLSAQRRRIGRSALRLPTALTPGDTTSMVAADQDGLVVSYIHSLGLAFGSGVFVPEGGFFLNNRAGRSFNRIPGHPNQAEGGKRPMHTLLAWIAMRGGEPVLAGNTMGGDGQPQWNLQVLIDLVAGGRLPGEAVSLPRLTVLPATDAHTLDDPTVVHLEARFSPEVVANLERRGHRLKMVGPWGAGGSVQVVQRVANGWAGASDPRGIGQTLGL